MALDLVGFAYSFSHAIVRVNERQFTDVSAVSISQELTEAAVYGTDARPMKRSVGQLSMGQGQLTFSDMGEATDFFATLGDEPFMALWALDYALTKPDGSFRSVECLSCRLTSFGIEHQAGGDALGMNFPFSFLQVKVDGRDLVMSPKSLIQAGLNVAQNLVNLL
jgi:hypothetical protein